MRSQPDLASSANKQNQKTETQESAKISGEPQKKKKPFLQRMFKPKLVPDWCMVVITAILALYTYKLFSSATQQTEVAHNSLKVLKESLRPDVRIDDERGSIENLGRDGIRIKIRNFGSLVADHVTIHSRADRRLSDFPDNTVVYTNTKSFPAIAARETRELLETVNFPYSKAQEDSIRNSPNPHSLNDSLFLHLRVTYKALGDSFTSDIGLHISDWNNEHSYCRHNK